MAVYKDPAFQERVERAAAAKRKALEQLKAKPPVDEAVLAERNAARLAREAAEAEKRAAAKAAKQQAEAEKQQAAAEAAAQAAEIEALAEAERQRSVPTEAERKAARDARYAARKSKTRK